MRWRSARRTGRGPDGRFAHGWFGRRCWRLFGDDFLWSRNNRHGERLSDNGRGKARSAQTKKKPTNLTNFAILCAGSDLRFAFLGDSAGLSLVSGDEQSSPSVEAFRGENIDARMLFMVTVIPGTAWAACTMSMGQLSKPVSAHACKDRPGLIYPTYMSQGCLPCQRPRQRPRPYGCPPLAARADSTRRVASQGGRNEPPPPRRPPPTHVTQRMSHLAAHSLHLEFMIRHFSEADVTSAAPHHPLTSCQGTWPLPFEHHTRCPRPPLARWLQDETASPLMLASPHALCSPGKSTLRAMCFFSPPILHNK